MGIFIYVNIIVIINEIEISDLPEDQQGAVTGNQIDKEPETALDILKRVKRFTRLKKAR